MQALRGTVERSAEQHARETDELKHVLRKCLDTQHMLSATVVAIQRDFDDQHPRDALPGLARIDAAVDDLRANQHKLRDALRMLQSCTQSAHEACDAQCERLAHRVQAAEETFARLTDDSLARADDLVRRLCLQHCRHLLSLSL